METPHIEVASKPPGIAAWLACGRTGLERLAYILQRISGLGLLFYFLLHIVITSLRVKHLYLWEEPHLLEEPPFKFAEFLVFLGFAYHAFNGVRLLLVELGVPVGRPVEPAPGRPREVLRPLVLVIMLLAFLFLMAGGHWFLTASD